MKDVTAHITLSRSLESDINLFRAWEADKYDFRVLDAGNQRRLVAEIIGVFGTAGGLFIRVDTRDAFAYNHGEPSCSVKVRWVGV